MIPVIIVKIALIIVFIRSVIVGVKLLQSHSKHWLEILFQFSVAIVAVDYYFRHFGSIL